MKKWQIITIEWISYIALLLLYVYLDETFVASSRNIAGFAAYLGSAIGTAGIPLVLTIVILLIRIIKNKKDIYPFFSRVLWITTTVLLLMSIYGICLHRDGGYGSFLCAIPFAIGALYWVGKYKTQEKVNPQSEEVVETPTPEETIEETPEVKKTTDFYSAN